MSDITASTDQIIGATAYDEAGDKIGKVGQVYLDDESGSPEWVTVSTGLFGTRESFVPLKSASLDGDRLVIPFDKAKVKDAPNISSDEHLSPDEESRLYSYYGIGSAGLDSGSDVSTSNLDTDYDRGAADADLSAAKHDRSGAGDAMTVSEERLKVGTETQAVGKARLRKHVVTEHQTVQVPVSREEVVVDREPITDANRDAAFSGSDFKDDEHAVTLHEERPVVSTESVPVERVRLGTETVTGTETVSEDVRKEKVDLDGDGIQDSTGLGDDLRRKEASSYDQGATGFDRKEASSYDQGASELDRKEASSYATPDDTVDRRI